MLGLGCWAPALELCGFPICRKLFLSNWLPALRPHTARPEAWEFFATGERKQLSWELLPCSPSLRCPWKDQKHRQLWWGRGSVCLRPVYLRESQVGEEKDKTFSA